VPPPITATAAPAAVEDAKTWINNFVKFRKNYYNKFHYRLGRQDAATIDAWKKLKMEGTCVQAEDFVNMVMDGNVMTQSDFSTKTDIVELLSTWQTWKEALNKYDEDALICMVRASTLETRRDPAIPEHLLVKWPKYLQVRVQAESEAKRKENGSILTDNRQLEEEEFNDKTTEFKTWIPKQGPASSHSGMRTDPQPATEANKMPEAVQVALKSVRLAHSVCDKFIRDVGVVIAASKDNPNSTGCKIETDLTSLQGTLAAEDKEILIFENLCRSNAKVGGKSIETVAATVKRIDESVKTGRKKVNALKSLFKL
jgi:hypothetical protein